MRGLSRQHNRVLKSIFKGAATTVITQRNKDPIHARYQRLLDGGTKPTLAKLSLAHDRSHGTADVEGRGGVRPRTSRFVHGDTRRLGNDSIGVVDKKAVIRARSREECSHATLCVAAEVSIHVLPGLRPTVWRSDR
jgi:hypothetical protein